MNHHSQLFAQRYTQHIDEIYRFLFFAVNQQQEIAEDLASETFLKAFEHHIPATRLDRNGNWH
ncbi:MAG: hypothetical protein HYV32_05835 [Candidatus Kerfeldbacteria bacterium]|nr:hypothetical protein [Candidatus Kerfeldbacteria bacterium]